MKELSKEDEYDTGNDENQLDMGEPKLRVEMLFKDAKFFRIVLREHSIIKGYDFKFVKNESTRKPTIMTRAIRREQGVFVPKNQIYGTKCKALEAIEGNHKEDFYKVRDYCGMVGKTNHGIVAVVLVIKGLMARCKPIIRFDTCHLKGALGGQLMHVVGRDGNNQMFALVVVTVEAKNKDLRT
ncbi:hypothetical protein CDL12_13510 [Handroanthus impetiginosus]|uniref:Uncharacterized protein n=1 Tax=Handroanthus impetiginosus TaxID=429701 RepID=A0A2G9H8K8_9LAMI|nr:hypothetical protein CDL12_13510 [Handroanthus impetiginosus]